MSYLKLLYLSALTLFLATTLSAQEGVAFNKTFTLKEITFHVTCPNDSSLSKLTIRTKGLERDDVITKKIDGTVSSAEIADLNSDGTPEIYVFSTSAGSGSYGSVIAYSSNHNKSLSEIYFPEDDLNLKAFQGYMGHDKFTIVRNRLVRHFPVYTGNDSNAKPTGGRQQLEYELVPGEAVWQLKLLKTTNIK